jgi:hypothetical protein
MTIHKWDESQLEFDLDLDEVNDDAQVRSISFEESRQISQAAKQVFEGTVLPEWFAQYKALQDKGWPWRVAAYIAWASSPKTMRKPETLADLATECLGLKSPRVIYTWRKKYPSLDTVVSMIQTESLWEHRRDVMEALVSSASGDYKGYHDRRLFFEMTGDYTPKSKLELSGSGKADDIHEKSDAELRRWAGEEDPSLTPNPSPLNGEGSEDADGDESPLNEEGSEDADGDESPLNEEGSEDADGDE